MDIVNLLWTTKEKNASDLHITVGASPTIRLHGTLQKLDLPALTKADIEEMLNNLLTEEQKRKFAEEKEIDFSLDIQGTGRFRVNTFMQRKGPGSAFRYIPEQIRPLDELGFPPVLKTLALKEKGLVLVTGPTGCGKSTTLAAIVDLINTQRHGHIITIEDPIEFIHNNKNCIVNQREIGHHTKSFASALRSALREDPDIILVGEMRDLETMSLALTATETGHLVLGTLHTLNAVKSIDRIINVFPSEQQPQIRLQLAESIEGILAQILLPTADGQGRVAAVEVMVGIAGIRSLIREGKVFQIPTLVQTGTRYGMQSMDQSLKNLLMAQKVSKEEVMKHVTSPESFAQLIGK